MTPNDYQKQAYAFCQAPTDKELGYFSMAVEGEVGEIINVHKKEIRNNQSYQERIMDESGDVVWYLCALGSEYDFTFEDVIRISKELKKVYCGTLRSNLRSLSKAAAYLDEYLELNPFSEARFLIYHVATVFFWLNSILKTYDLSLVEVMEFNLAKLSERSERNSIKEHA